MRNPGDGQLGAERVVVVGFAVDPAARDELKAIAREQDRSVSSVVRDIVLAALNKRDRQRFPQGAPKKARQSAKAAKTAAPDTASAVA